MPIVKLTSHNLDHQLTEIAGVILGGGVVLLPTDTIYGLSALATNEGAVQRVSVILPSRHRLPSTVSANLPTIALRWPSLPWLEQLIGLVGQPIISTSANLTGEEPITNITMVSHYFAPDKLDLIVDGGRLNSHPSSLIDLTTKDFRAIRSGS